MSGEAGGEQQNIIQMIGQGINNAIKPFIPGGSQGSGATNQVAQSGKNINHDIHSFFIYVFTSNVQLMKKTIREQFIYQYL